MGTAGLIFAIFSQQLPAFYSDDAAVIGLSAQLLLVAVFFQFSDGLQRWRLDCFVGWKMSAFLPGSLLPCTGDSACQRPGWSACIWALELSASGSACPGSEPVRPFSGLEIPQPERKSAACTIGLTQEHDRSHAFGKVASSSLNKYPIGIDAFRQQLPRFILRPFQPANGSVVRKTTPPSDRLWSVPSFASRRRMA